MAGVECRFGVLSFCCQLEPYNIGCILVCVIVAADNEEWIPDNHVSNIKAMLRGPGAAMLPMCLCAAKQLTTIVNVLS